METGTIGKWCFHVHHDKPVERLIEPLEKRIAYIKEVKPKKEQATRLRLIHIVKDQDGINKAYKVREAEMEKPNETYRRALDKLDKAWEVGEIKSNEFYYMERKKVDETCERERKKVDEAFESAILPIHAKECKDCPWDGKTIFPVVK